MTDWTPGPWTTRKARMPTDGKFDFAVGARVGDKLHCIAEAFGRVDDHLSAPAEANARLIAAAPDLYEALRGFMRARDVHVFVTQNDDPRAEECALCGRNFRDAQSHISSAEISPARVFEQAVSNIRAALAKAEGK